MVYVGGRRGRGDGWGGHLMSMHASILVDSVGPPSAEVCRTIASFPYVDHPRFIELREEEVKAIPLKQHCNYDTRSLLCPEHTKYTCQMYRCTSLAKR
jgi:hypothetical protein